ncbi:unnamed protein product, partial [Protopolystoma xenopodis]
CSFRVSRLPRVTNLSVSEWPYFAKSFTDVSDGHGGRLRVPKAKGAKRDKTRGSVPGVAGAGGRARRNTRRLDGAASDGVSDASTASELVRQRMQHMTEQEKTEYLRERDKRKQAREKLRREKYGDQYDKQGLLPSLACLKNDKKGKKWKKRTTDSANRLIKRRRSSASPGDSSPKGAISHAPTSSSCQHGRAVDEFSNGHRD